MKIRIIRNTFKGLVLLLSSYFILACGPKLKNYPSLTNQGILPISPSNSYLGTNLFLGDEAAKSRILFQFLKGRGAPGAIEIVDEDFKPVRLFMFYPRQVQVYLAELSTDRENYDWIIRGPYNIARNDFRKLVEVERANYEASPLIVDGKIEHFVAETPKPTPTPLVVVEHKPKPPVHKKKIPTVIKSKKASPPEVEPNKTVVEAQVPRMQVEIPSGPGLNSDQQAIRISKGLTALTAEGDLLHSVKTQGETLDSIANWYTKDPAQAKAIAEYNSLPASSPLPKGAKLKIPKALAKTEQAMPKQAVEAHQLEPARAESPQGKSSQSDSHPTETHATETHETETHPTETKPTESH